jgi:hypothetical protein
MVKRVPGGGRFAAFLFVLASILLVAALFVPALGAAAREDDNRGRGAKVLEFHTMAPVAGPFVGPNHPIRGFGGGGLPWVIDSGRGEVRANGDVEARVRGLVLDPNSSAVPANLKGINPLPQFSIWMSCLTNDKPDTGTALFAGTFAATTTGNMEGKGHVNLPRPCVAPIVFVTTPSNQQAQARWLAATGIGVAAPDEDDD